METEPTPKRRLRRRRALLAVLVLVLLAAAAGAAAVAWARAALERPYKGYPGDELKVLIEPGQSGRAILERLEREGVLSDARLARAYLRFGLDDATLKAGEYGFAGELTIPQVLDKLVRGEVVTYRVTLIEGLTLEETAAHLADSGFGQLDAFLAAMRSPEEIADLDPAAEDLEGYLFPETYAFARATPESAIVATLVRTFRRTLEEVRATSPPTELSVRGLVTLASIVEKEAQLDDERPVVAGVYANRLRRGMALQADPTVIFALKRLGTWNGNLRRPDLRMDSPYNTYRYPGLPPGPIASPGAASLAAAAAPAEVPYFYFVSRNDGSHVFARTLKEHNRNVEIWQRQYWRKRWAEERAAKDQSD